MGGGLKKFKDYVIANKNTLEIEKETLRNVITGKIYKLMEIEGKSKADLAKSLEVSKPAITRLLSGDNNFTIDKISEVSFYLGYTPFIYFKKSGVLDPAEVKHIFERMKQIQHTVNIKIVDSKTKNEIYVNSTFSAIMKEKYTQVFEKEKQYREEQELTHA
jgi:plasmid maintenance system antidote protein VapI